MFDIAVPAMIGVALIVVLGIVFTILYKRATRDEAFVRTGLGGKKVVLDGGAMILPIFHSYAQRQSEDAAAHRRAQGAGVPDHQGPPARRHRRRVLRARPS